MPKMYKEGSEAVDVHPTKIADMELRGWTQEEKPSADDKPKPKTKTKK